MSFQPYDGEIKHWKITVHIYIPITYIVWWYKTLYQVEPVVWTSITRRVVIRLVHATGKTWYKVLYQHTMYVISLSNISIKTNFKQKQGWIKMCTILWGRLHFVYDVTFFFPFIHQRQVTVFCLTFHWYEVMSK